jgi:hypothetical protein
MSTAARRFVLLTLGLAGGVTLFIGLLNWVVDPYNRFGHNRLGVYISAERECKATEVRRFPHNALLIGNSRMAMVPVNGLNGFHFFNAALGGATAEEVYYFLQHFATRQEVVILGVELGQTDPLSLSGDLFAPATWTATLDNLLSLRTAEYSIRTIWSHFTGKAPALAADGSFDTAPWFAAWDRPDPAHLSLILEQLKKGYVRAESAMKEGASGQPPENIKERMSFYRRIAECLKQRGITCVVVIPPLHEAVARYIETSPVQARLQAWRRELDAIFPLVVDVSLGSYGAAENFFKADPLHFKPEAGVRMLNAEVIPVAVQAVQKKNGHPAVAQHAGGS